MKKVLFNCSLLLLVFLSLDHLLVLLSFLIGSWFMPFAFPLSILSSILLFIYLERKESLRVKASTIILSLSIIAVSLLFSAFYFDLSWDGQWYQQSAVYHISSDWNPILEPIRSFERNNDSSILHFPKGSWYYAASVYSTLGNLEAGKSINLILVFVSIFIGFSVLQDFGLSKVHSLVISLVAALNPVVWSEVTTFLVDGSLILYLCIYILIVFAWLRKPNYKSMLIGFMAIAGIINLKFTGLVFFCVLALFTAVGVLIYKRQYFFRFLGMHAVALLVSVIIYGYNPYVINFTERGHPFYPIMGTEEYPSVFEQTGRDDNEVFETPHNMQGKSLLVRMFYANFGRPDNAPYYRERDAELILPFTSKPEDWKAYYFHETRVSGFGPYFSGILILSLGLFVSLVIKDKKARWALCLALVALFGSLLFSKHFWWPRFGPQMWLIPVIPVCFYFYRPISKWFDYYTWVIAVIFLLNGSIVLFSHMYWETNSSITLRKQLTELRDENKTIEIFYGAFKKSMEEKLDRWHIEFGVVASPRIMMEGEHKNLTSVVEGYPNMVMYREKKENN